MDPQRHDGSRRGFLKAILAVGVLGGPLVSGLVRLAGAMGSVGITQGMRVVEGEVRINGVPAKVGDPVGVGDVVATGPDGRAVFVFEDNAFLLRSESSVTLDFDPSGGAAERAVNHLKMMSGRMLSVFGRGDKTMRFPTAVVGVRGTAVYAEASEARAYICTCYGEATIQSLADPSVRESVKTRYHDAPRFVYAAGAEALLVEAPVFNHTDEELIMLEELVWRLPPFVRGTYNNQYTY